MRKIFVFFSRIFLAPIVALLIKRIEGIENLPKEGGFLIASNHINTLDHFLIGFVLRDRLESVKFVAAKIDNFKNLIFWGWLYWLGQPLLVKKSQNDRQKILKDTIDCLEKGYILVIYPEGDTNPKEYLLRGKTGVAEIALKSKKTVVPVGISGGYFCKKIIRIGKPIIVLSQSYFENQDEYNLFLRKETDRIMEKISFLSSKVYNNNNNNHSQKYAPH